jgi:hypothetical protein
MPEIRLRRTSKIVDTVWIGTRSINKNFLQQLLIEDNGVGPILKGTENIISTIVKNETRKFEIKCYRHYQYYSHIVLK